MNSRYAQARMILAAVVLAFLGSVSAAGAQECPCNGDVTDDGIINVLDAVCIRECVESGACACCVNSCDLNCDGVVDDVDTAPDPLDDSVWLCLFQGFAVETCCPGPPDPSGACCNINTGTCGDDIVEQDCTGADFAWSQGMSCVEVACDPPPPPPTGACCNLGNGICRNSVEHAACDSTDRVWTDGASCTSVKCSVPPSDPCPCDGDANGDGVVNVLDAVCIRECVENDDCACCLGSCDLNCDGVVNDVDTAPDPLDESVWLCFFQGRPADECCALVPFRGGSIPTVGEWGLVVMTLLVLCGGTALIRRRAA